MGFKIFTAIMVCVAAFGLFNSAIVVTILAGFIWLFGFFIYISLEPKADMSDYKVQQDYEREYISEATKARIMLRQGYKCYTLGCNNRDYMHLHHIKPVSIGGSNDEFNLAYLCPICHARAHDPDAKGRTVQYNTGVQRNGI